MLSALEAELVRCILAMPSHISATVTAETKRLSECASIHATRAADRSCRPGAAADRTFVSTTTTGQACAEPILPSSEHAISPTV